MKILAILVAITILSTFPLSIYFLNKRENNQRDTLVAYAKNNQLPFITSISELREFSKSYKQKFFRNIKLNSAVMSNNYTLFSGRESVFASNSGSNYYVGITFDLNIGIDELRVITDKLHAKINGYKQYKSINYKSDEEINKFNSILDKLNETKLNLVYENGIATYYYFLGQNEIPTTVQIETLVSATTWNM